MKTKTHFRNDLILVCVLLIIVLITFLLFKSSLKSGSRAVVLVNGEKVSSFDLNEETTETIETPNGTNTIKIENGRLSVSDANCRDKICVNHKPILNVGETIVCLPHKLVVEIAKED